MTILLREGYASRSLAYSEFSDLAAISLTEGASTGEGSEPIDDIHSTLVSKLQCADIHLIACIFRPYPPGKTFPILLAFSPYARISQRSSLPMGQNEAGIRQFGCRLAMRTSSSTFAGQVIPKVASICLDSTNSLITAKSSRGPHSSGSATEQLGWRDARISQ